MNDKLHLPESAEKSRLLSLDIFRALTMLMMVFVNDIDTAGNSQIKDLPTWLKHAQPAEIFPLANLVFPTFLYIVGISIPLAIEKRRKAGQSWGSIYGHSWIRALGLILIGNCMGNMRVFYWSGGKGVYTVGLENTHLWVVLLFVSFILIWNRYPNAEGARRKLFLGCRVAGVGLLVFLLAIYRRGNVEEPTWMRWDWYIVGAIGLAYIVSTSFYILFRKHMAAMMGLLAILYCLFIGDRHGVFDEFAFLDGSRKFVPLGDMIGRYASLTVAGVIIGMLFVKDWPVSSARQRIGAILIFAGGCLVAGLLLRPLDESSKSAPYFNLYVNAFSNAAFALLYWLVDVRGLKRWAAWLLPVGKNVLLLYFLSFMVHPFLYAMGVHWINDYFSAGIPGLIRGVLFSVALTLFAGWLTSRYRIVLHL